MPARPLCIAMYLLELTGDALQKNTGCSAIDSALYGIRWAHKIAGLESPTEHPTVLAAAEGARRKLSKPGILATIASMVVDYEYSHCG